MVPIYLIYISNIFLSLHVLPEIIYIYIFFLIYLFEEPIQ